MVCVNKSKPLPLPGHNKAAKAATQHNLVGIEGLAQASSGGGVLCNDASDDVVQVNFLASSLTPDMIKALPRK